MITELENIEFKEDYMWVVAQLRRKNKHDEISRSFSNYKDVEDIAIPEYNEIKYTNGVKVSERKAVFEGYVFVNIKKGSDDWKFIENDENCVYNFLTARNKVGNRMLVNIKEHELDALKNVFKKTSSYQVGERVKIRAELMKGFEGSINSIYGRQVKVLLDNIRRLIIVDIDDLAILCK